MLTLTRSVGETIRIGDDIEVHVVEVRGGTVRLGFKAPREVAIHREEVYRQIAEANLLAAQVTADSLGALAAFAPSAAATEAAGSETAGIRLHKDADTLVLEIHDRGRGIPKASVEQIMRGVRCAGLGIAGMIERMEQLGGTLEITSGDHGTTIRARLRLVPDVD